MRTPSAIAALLACGALLYGSCGSDQPAPVAPTAPAALAPVFAPGSATLLEVGQTHVGTMRATDHYCGELDPLGTVLSPCQRFQLTPTSDGTLDVQLGWDNADSLIELVGPGPNGPSREWLPGATWTVICCTSPDHATFDVRAGQPLGIFVQWGGDRSRADLPRDATQDFTLTTSLQPGR